MPSYRRLGEVPPKRHIQFENQNEIVTKNSLNPRQIVLGKI